MVEQFSIKSIKAQAFLTFTGCHIGNLITPINYSEFYTYKRDNLYLFKSGLIVSIVKSTKIDINNSEFDIDLSSNIEKMIQSFWNNK